MMVFLGMHSLAQSWAGLRFPMLCDCQEIGHTRPFHKQSKMRSVSLCDPILVGLFLGGTSNRTLSLVLVLKLSQAFAWGFCLCVCFGLWTKQAVSIHSFPLIQSNVCSLLFACLSRSDPSCKMKGDFGMDSEASFPGLRQRPTVYEGNCEKSVNQSSSFIWSF